VCEIRILNFEQGIPESMLELSYHDGTYLISTSLIGDYNASNLAGAFAVLVSLGYDPRVAAKALSGLPTVPGRLEPVGSEDVPVFVDYAHTGVGLENVLKAVKSFVKGDLWVLFGCGGGKDPRKRMDMGVAARDFADKIVLTDDNPKLENPDKIMNEILLSGCEPEFMIHDRAEAILKTLISAKQGDVVILAGKGHEDYQIIGSETFHFSDKEEVDKARTRGLLTRP
jgi:UDP-N-acetylmuramoyl-L-alanyl-D-glutamate--2,6-diaminopimelate ligase